MGGGPPTRGDLDHCFARIRSWLVLARDVVHAEFPSFQLVSCFAAFACIEKGKKVTDAVKSKIQRLSQTFKRPHLLRQFTGFWEPARKELIATGCAYHEAWVNAVLRFRDESRSNLPSDCLLHVLIRLRAFAACTSSIEQSFSVILKTFGKQRFGMHPYAENMAITVLLARNMSEPELENIFKRAQELWDEALGSNSRTHRDRKTNYGIKVGPTSNSASSSAALPSERSFRKRLHDQIVSKSGHVDHVEELDTYEAPDHAWTAGHEYERKFNRDKLDAKRVEANIRDLMLPHEKNPALQAASRRELERRAKALGDRVKTYRKNIDIINPGRPTIVDHHIFVLDECWSDSLAQSLDRHNCRRVREESQATVFIMRDPFASDSPDKRRVQWAAALMGAAICVPHVYTHDHTGPWVRLKCALIVRRFFFATPAFQDEYPRLWYLLLTVIIKPESNWTPVDLDQFLAAKLKFPAGHRVIAVCTQREYDTAVASGVTNMFTPRLLLQFVQQMDETQSVLH